MQVTFEEVLNAMKKSCWRTNTGTGVLVVYPDDVLHELFGTDADEVCLESTEKK